MGGTSELGTHELISNASAAIRTKLADLRMSASNTTRRARNQSLDADTLRPLPLQSERRLHRQGARSLRRGARTRARATSAAVRARQYGLRPRREYRRSHHSACTTRWRKWVRLRVRTATLDLPIAVRERRPQQLAERRLHSRSGWRDARFCADSRDRLLS